MQSLSIRMLHDGWCVDDIDTARDVDFLTLNEKDVFLAMNALRSDPAKFAQLYLSEIMNYYDGEFLKYPNEIPILTHEGLGAVKELYNQLLTHPSLGVIYPSRGMSRAAADHSLDQSITGKTSHNGTDRSDPFSRMNRYGTWGKTASENIAYGNSEGLKIILQLAIDDGISPRGHRADLLNSDFRVGGVSISCHPEFGHSCTIDYAVEYVEMA